MRSLALLLAFLAAGCLASPADRAASPPSEPSESFHTTGRLWLPEQRGQAPPQATLTFVVNSSSYAVLAKVRIAASLNAVDAPATASTVKMTLVDPAGNELASDQHEPGPATTHELKAPPGAAGTFSLVFDCQLTGGGAGTGDYADFEIRAE